MSAKCKYSPKFWPLVKQMQSLGNQAFEQFMIENFVDGKTVYDNIVRGANYSPANNIVNEVKPLERETATKVIKEDPRGSVESLYVGNPREYRNTVKAFKKEIISASVFSMTEDNGKLTQKFIDAGKEENGHTVLNNNILNYKLSLINKLREGSGLDIIETIESDSELNDIVQETIETYSSLRSKDVVENTDLKNAYVTLTRFDSLLNSFAPFVEVNPVYKKTKKDGIDKYVYKGPNVQHFTGFSTSEWADALEQSSDLAKLLLDFLPESREDGSIIPESSIGLEGFTSVMCSLQSELRNPYFDNMKDLSPELDKGAKIDMNKVLTEYISALETRNVNAESIEGSHLTYMLGKLRGIRDFIYNSNMEDGIKDMFTAMFFKNVPIKYRVYSMDQGRLAGRNLSESYVNNQLMRMYDVIQASTYQLEKNKEKLDYIKYAYNIDIKNNKITLFTNTNGGVKSEVELNLTYKNRLYKIDSHGIISDGVAKDLIYDVLGMVVSDEFMDLMHQLHPEDTRSLFEIFKEAIVLPLISANNKHYRTSSSLRKTTSGLLTDLYVYKGALTPIANIQSVIYGSETASVIKNLAGNNVPKYQLISLAQNYRSMLRQYEDNPGIYENNLLFKNRNSNFVEDPLVRSDVAIGGQIKSSGQLTVNEVMQLCIFNDFYNMVDSGTIYLQNTTFADKGTHYLIPYNIKNTFDDGTNLQEIIQEALKNGNTDKLIDLIYNTREAKMLSMSDQLLSDYSSVFDEDFGSLREVDNYLQENKIDLSTLRAKFAVKGLTFFEEVHGYSPDKKVARINETIMNYYDTFTDRSKLQNRLNKEMGYFIKNLLDNGFKLNRYNLSTAGYDMSVKYPGWYDSNSGNIKFVKAWQNGKPVEIRATNTELLTESGTRIELHPVLKTFFMTDVLLSNEYTSLMTGEVWAHPNKNKEGSNEKEYFEFSEANRLIAQNKRAVIYGATTHPFLQNLKYGVPETMSIAVVSDIPGTVWNMLGEVNDGLDTIDGSGFSSPYQSRFENNSLVDAAVGNDKKTIMHDNNAKYGLPTLLKWAVYELTNARRRFSYGSDMSFEHLFGKMHNQPIDPNILGRIEFNRYYNNWVEKNGGLLKIQNLNTGEITTLKNIYFDPEALVWKQSFVEEIDDIPVEIKSIADIDRLFGGAWGKFEDANGELKFADANIDIVSTILGDYNLKNHFVGYVVNKSAIKVGSGNINSTNSFYNDVPLSTIPMSTKFGGVQMNADHDIEKSHVTEMTQMLSALIQNGLSTDIVNKIYSDIGNIVAEVLSDFSENINAENTDYDKLYTLLGKALIDSFMDKDKDTLGLAQAFVAKAEKSLSESNLRYKLPFSAATINGSFIATVTSMLNKKGIRRKYDGLAGVLTPSHDAMQYYRIGNDTLTFDELHKIINPVRTGVWESATNNDFINKRYFTDSLGNSAINPFLRPINARDIDFEDTVLWSSDPQLPIDSWKEIKVDSPAKFYDIRNRGGFFMNWTIKPKNLKQSNVFFDVEGLGRFSMYDLDSVEASYWLANVKPKDWDERVIQFLNDRIYTKTINGEITFIPAENLTIQERLKLEQQKTKETLRDIELGREFEFRGNTVTATNVEFTANEIIMGRRNAEALGLREGDSLYDISQQKSDFFYNRLKQTFEPAPVDSNIYDCVMFDSSGDQIFVMVDTEENAQNRLHDYHIAQDDTFTIIDGEVYLNDKRFSSSEGKQFYTVTDHLGNQQKLVVVNDPNRLKELINTNQYPVVRYNYIQDNYWKNFVLSNMYNFEKGIPVRLNGIPIQTEEELLSLGDPVSVLLDNETTTFEQKLRKLANERYDSFNKQLNLVCARIPTQGMQSFMSMKVVGFTDSKLNDVYVTKSNTWLEGSDYRVNRPWEVNNSFILPNNFVITIINSVNWRETP